MEGGACQATIHEVTKSQTQLSYFTFTFSQLASQAGSCSSQGPDLDKSVPSGMSCHQLVAAGLLEPTGNPLGIMDHG